MFLEIVENLGLLLLSGLVLFFFNFAIPRLSERSLLRPITIGIVLGLAGLTVATFAVGRPDGSVTDARAGPMLLAGFLGGPLGGAVAAAIASVGRGIQGGSFMAAGMASFFTYALLGMLFRAFLIGRNQRPNLTWVNILVLVVLSQLGLAIGVLLIADIPRATAWLSGGFPIIYVMNAAAVFVMSLAARAALEMVDTRRRAADLSERLELAADAAGIGVWDYDVATGDVTWNRTQYKLHGIEPGEFSGVFDDWTRNIHPDDRERAVQTSADALKTQADYDTRYRVQMPDGDFRELRGIGRVVLGPDGTPQRMLGINYDVTEFHAVEREAAEYKRRLAEVAETIPGAIFRLHVEPDGTTTVKDMSPGCVDLWDLPAEAFLADASVMRDMIVPEFRKAYDDALSRSAQSLEMWRHEWPIISSQGHRKMLQGQGIPRRTDDGGTDWSMLVLDITAATQIKNDLASSQELFFEAQKLDAVGKLTGGVAHDFNNLLAVIMGNLELLRSTVDQEDADLIKDALSAAKRGARLTQQLLAFGRRAPIHPKTVDLNHVLVAFERLLRRTVPETIRIETVLGAGVWPVKIDRGLMENALLNLALNSRDSMPDGGCLTLETANVRLGQDYLDDRGEVLTPGRYVMVAVSDTGTGMALDVARNAFQPFFTTKPPGSGSGMGLAMVHGFVKQSNGIVRLYSEPGAGTTVKVYFPAQPSARVQEEPPEQPLDDTTVSRHILLVEDDPEVRAVVRRQLERIGHQVTECVDGSTGLLAATSDGSIELVITDVVMPGPLQGPAMVEKIREERSDLPVIFLSGYPQDASINGIGVRDTDIQLVKPVEFDAMARVLRDVFA